MKKISLLLITITIVGLLSSCGNTLFNAGGIYVDEITAINLPEDGDYALAGAFFEESWSNTYNTQTSSDGTVTWTFDPAIEVAVGNGTFKIVKSGTWSFAVEGSFKDPHDNADIYNVSDLTIDGDTYSVEWDASQTVDEGLTVSK